MSEPVDDETEDSNHPPRPSNGEAIRASDGRRHPVRMPSDPNIRGMKQHRRTVRTVRTMLLGGWLWGPLAQLTCGAVPNMAQNASPMEPLETGDSVGSGHPFVAVVRGNGGIQFCRRRHESNRVPASIGAHSTPVKLADPITEGVSFEPKDFFTDRIAKSARRVQLKDAPRRSVPIHAEFDNHSRPFRTRHRPAAGYGARIFLPGKALVPCQRRHRKDCPEEKKRHTQYPSGN